MELAEFGLQEDDGFEGVVLLRGRLEPFPFDFNVSDAREEKYRALLASAGIFGFNRQEDAVYIPGVGGGKRRDRLMSGTLYYPGDAFADVQDCSGADFSAEYGHCIVGLSHDWVVLYQWLLPFEYYRLKCIGVLREHGDALNDPGELQRLNRRVEVVRFFEDVSRVDASVAEHWISVGAAEYVDLRQSGAFEDAEYQLESCMD